MNSQTTSGKIEHQRAALRTGHADHHGVVRGAFGLRQHAVTMIDAAAEHARLTRAAQPFAAAVFDINGGVEQNVEQGLARGHEQRPAAAREFHRVAGALRALDRRARREAFDMHVRDARVGTRCLERIEHHTRAAAVRMHVLRLTRETRGQIERQAVVFVVEMQQHVAAQRGQFVEKRGLAAAARAIDELHRLPALAQLAIHAQHRCHADAARDQQRRRRRFVEREVVARRADRQRRAAAQFLVQPARTAAALCVVQYADHIAAALFGRVDERIAAREAVRQMHVEMRARRERRKHVAFHRHQFDARNALRLVAQRAHARLQAGLRADLRADIRAVSGVVHHVTRLPENPSIGVKRRLRRSRSLQHARHARRKIARARPSARSRLHTPRARRPADHTGR
ncbi:hypothetical protein PT2222_60194 [Paraburkholderia tropica]